jgi:hypothetical protein
LTGAYGSYPEGSCTEAVQLVTHFCGDCADAEEALIATINAITKQKIGRMRSLPSDFVIAMRIVGPIPAHGSSAPSRRAAGTKGPDLLSGLFGPARQWNR